MKTILLLALALILAPVAILAAHGAHNLRWPACLIAALLLVGVILGARLGLAW
jgi:hypothetical protein